MMRCVKIKLLLLLYVEVVSSAYDWISCTKEERKMNYPCAKPQSEGGRGFRYKNKVREFVSMAYENNTSCLTVMDDYPLDYDTVQWHCTSLLGSVPDFSNSEFEKKVYEWLKTHNSKCKALGFWALGKRHSDGEWYWYKSKMKIGLDHPRWGENQPDNDPDKNCLTYQCSSSPPTNCFWKNVDCQISKPCTFCKYSISFYFRGYMFSLVTVPAGSPSTIFNMGERLKILCSSKDLDPIQLRMTLANGAVHVVYGNKTKTANFAELPVYKDSSTSPGYRMYGPQCSAEYSIRLNLVAMVMLNGTRVQCCVKNGTSCEEKILEVLTEPFKPMASVDKEVDKRHVFLGDNVTYRCTARLGLGDTMTVALTTNSFVWGRTYGMDNKILKFVTGKLDEDIAQFDIESGFDEALSGNHINITMTFTAKEYLAGSVLSCHSENVLDKLRKEGFSQFNNLSDARRLTAAHYQPVLNVDEPTELNEDGNMIVYGCETVSVSCKSYLGSGFLTLEITMPGEKVKWNSRQQKLSTSLPWLTISSSEYRDGFYGRRISVTADLYVTSNMSTVSKLLCMATVGTRSSNVSLDTNFIFKYGSTPPQLMVDSVADTPEGKGRVEMNCTSQVGESETQTLHLIDYSGLHNYWYVSRSGSVKGKVTFAWLELKLQNSSWSEDCGWSMTISVSLSLIALGRGATIKCYSYHVRQPVTSRFSVKELVASHKIACTVDCVETEEEGTVWLVLYIVVVAISVYFVFCIIVRRCRQKRVKEATQVTQTEQQQAEVEEQPIVEEPPEEPLRYLEIVDLTSDTITPAQDMKNSLAVNTTRRLSSVVAGSYASKGTDNSSNKAQLK